MKLIQLGLGAAMATSCGSSVAAEVFDYRPSEIVGREASLAVGSGIGAPALIGSGMYAAGFYLFPHAAGMTMLGSTLAGASGAGTIGIIGGTGGLIGFISAFKMSPALIGGSAVAVAAGSGFEGVCYFSDDRVDDPKHVEALLQAFADMHENDGVEIEARADTGPARKALVLTSLDGDESKFDVSDIYIRNGHFRVRRSWRRDISLEALEPALPPVARYRRKTVVDH